MTHESTQQSSNEPAHIGWLQVEKVLQLHLACLQRIGVIIVGPSGSGKSTIWRLLQAALTSLGRPPVLHALNPKAISRHHLLGACSWANGL